MKNIPSLRIMKRKGYCNGLLGQLGTNKLHMYLYGTFRIVHKGTKILHTFERVSILGSSDYKKIV